LQGFSDVLRYTFRMNMLFWLAVIAFAAALVWLAWFVRRKAEERRLAEEARAAAFVSELGAAARPTRDPVLPRPAPASPAPAPIGDIALQKLLFEAAHKAGEAGEAALAIQLYARLLARYPATSFAEPARAAAAALKKKLVKT
jgi:hypothetical protein